MGRVSEEELLGLPPSGLHRRRELSAQPARPPARTVGSVAPTRTRRRLRAKDVLVAVAVVGAVWVAIRGAESRAPGYEPVGVVPTDARADAGAYVVTRDRGELQSLLRERPTTEPPAPGKASGSAGTQPSGGRSGGSDGSSVSKGDEDPTPPPPTETSDPPLLEANVPGVGSVTVENPDLPDTDDVLPHADALPDTSTLPLP
jgi:hypothetical protein